ncbi:MAG: hemerythrin domain-containing protein, partial [Selenomonas sp.]|uniref:hemerythrin domain-containing protein n=1 Tax=Selenomonas sp. TaxID=2053611 RepID=UPI0025CFCC44
DHHASIYEHINTIIRNKTDMQIEQNVDEVTKALARLAGLISIHLAAEDKFLYPNLEKSDNETVRDLSRSFNAEMGGLAKTFMDYKEEFMTPTKIKANLAKFRQDTDRVIGALQERMQREDNDLYPLVQE